MGVLDELDVDHVTWYVSDASVEATRLTQGFGFSVYATGRSGRARSVALGGNEIRLVLTEPLAADHPGAGFLSRHDDGVADIALRVPDVATAYGEAVRDGARPVAPPLDRGGVVTATIHGFGDLTHTFVQREAGDDGRALPGLRPAAGPVPDTGLTEVDHFAVCVADGDLAATADFYRSVLGFEETFHERIVIGDQAMTTLAVQSTSGRVTFTLIEPDTTGARGQLMEFLDRHGGAGVQHLAFRADDIVKAVEASGARGVEFLTTPADYYALLAERTRPIRYSIPELRRLNVLVDEDHDGQLYQIFTRSVHPRDTFFFEIIERLGSHSFGNGNIRALYEAVERRRVRKGAAAGIALD